MVALSTVRSSNARLRELGPGLVALFVGGTSGIGEFTLKAFVQNAVSPRVYLVGRNEKAANRIIMECKTLNENGKVEFIKADVSELQEVDRVCKEIGSRESRVNLVVQTQGNANLRGRDESPEGLDRKFSLNYYSRMRFISNLLPFLNNASTTTPGFARCLTVLGAGTEGKVNFDDLELKNTFSGPRCAAHSIVMNDLIVDEFSTRQPSISFIHSYPSIVNTGLIRELPLWARAVGKVSMPLLSPFMVSAEETGQRQLFHATSGLYPPSKPVEAMGAGVPIPPELKVAKGGNGEIGSGGYLVNWNGDVIKQKAFLIEYREKGRAKSIWEHTMNMFEKVETVNLVRSDTAKG